MTNSDPGADARRVQEELVAHPMDATVPLTRNEVVELSRRLSDSHDLHPHHTRAWVLVALEQFADLLARHAADARRVAPLDPRLEWQPIETLPIVGYFSSGGPERFSSLPDPPGEAQRIPAPPDAPQEL